MDTAVNKSKLYDVAKCLTMLLVVTAHVTRMYSPEGAVRAANQSYFLENVTNYIYAFHMPLFIFLSGCVYGYCVENGKYGDSRRFLRNKAKKLLIPYFAFGILYVAPVMCLLGLTELGCWDYIVEGILLSNNSRHLWYVLALFWIFLLAMLLKPLMNRGLPGLAVMECVSLILFALSKKVPVQFQLQAACSYQLFFFYGVLFNRFYPLVHRIFCKCYAAGILMPFLMLGVFWFNPNFLTAYAYKFLGTGMILLLSWCLLRWLPKLTDAPLYRCIQKNAFGIYLFHPMIIYVLFHFLGKYDIHPLLLSGGILLVAMGMSIAAAGILRRLRLRLLIGE